MNRSRTFTRAPLAAAACLALAAAANAQNQTIADADANQTVTVTGRGAAALSIGGFGDLPLSRSPMQAVVVSAEQLNDAGIASLADVTRLDASLGDGYNSEGYWSNFRVRGFLLDPRYNYRRDGLPINAETAIALGNKERVEVLKGTSGIQAGTSAPGGLVNLSVKRPTTSLRSAGLGWREDGTLAAHIDWSERFGADSRSGLRVNAMATHMDPQTRHTRGQASLLALAGNWALSADSLLEAEVEASRQSQPSVPGFSLLGGRLPSASSTDPRINLNHQPWTQPVVLAGTTASLRWQQALPGGWRLQAHGAVQRLRSDDRVAFPFGCTDAGADIYYANGYCPDGSFDLYDYRSEGERRNTSALDINVRGQAQTGVWQHTLSAGVLTSRTKDRFNRQAYNYAGQGNVNGSPATEPQPELTDENTNRDERSTEWYLRDAIELTPTWAVWAGLRHTRLQRDSVRTDGSRATSYSQAFTTPWLALTHRLSEATTVYASWGQGIESTVAPNRARYTNAGETLPALKSRQFETGIKYAADPMEASATAFDIRQPLAVDTGACDGDSTCTRRIDGAARHRGLEAALGLRQGRWQWQASAMLLQTKGEGAEDASNNGLRPASVPKSAFKLRAGYDSAAWPGLNLSAGLVHEGARMVLPDNSIEAPGWTRLDLGARLASRLGSYATVWRVGVDNVTGTQAWRETPYQFSHVYLFPLAPRTWRASVQVSL